MLEQQRLARAQRAAALAEAGSLAEAVRRGGIPARVDLTLSEALVLGLWQLGVRRYVGIFGHGSTDLGEVLRIYQQAGLLRVFHVRHETATAHAASALRWVTGEPAAVFTSIGPGALHAFAGSLVAASDGLGVWHLYGDETTEDEGPNMQQLPRGEQGQFLRLCQTMGAAYCLHTPTALPEALRKGQAAVDHPYRPGPCFLLLPMNTQPAVLPAFPLAELPLPVAWAPGPAADGPALDEAADLLLSAERVVVKVGQGARGASAELLDLLDLVDGVAVWTPIASGIVPAHHPRALAVSGSKGSSCGNRATDQADLLLAVGTRFVCQSDSSRTAYPGVRRVITIDADPATANHYGRNVPLVGDARTTLLLLNARLRQRLAGQSKGARWLDQCRPWRAEWDAWRQARYDCPTLVDPLLGRPLLTQPTAIKIAADWAQPLDIPIFFDAGDVQANGFQVVDADRPGQVFTETGASYMGFAASALLATALATEPFYGLALTGDGSFTMNPQILIDGVVHGATGCLLLLDNRRMAAISGLQLAQYGHEFATSDGLAVDYLAWARSVPGVLALDGGDSPASLRQALDQAHGHRGLSLIHLPVYSGDDPLGGCGAFGSWNVGSWVAATTARRHDIAL